MEGVHFSCQPNCGRCCDQPGGIVYLSEDDAERLAAHAELSVPDWLERDTRTTFDGRYVLKSREEDGIRDPLWSRRLGDVYKRQVARFSAHHGNARHCWGRTS